MMLPAMLPDARARVRSQSRPHAGSWLTAIPAEPATTLAPQAMQLALRHRLRMPLPLCHGKCGPAPSCGAQVDRLGDHALACPRTGLLARRAKVVERVWARAAREAVGAEGQVVPQQWLVHTTAPGVRTEDRRRLDVVIYGATPNGSALCCDATLVSPLTTTAMHGLPGAPAPRAAEAPCAWQRGWGALQRRRAAAGARPGPTAVLQSAASPARRRIFRLDASLVGHAVCRRKHYCFRLTVCNELSFIRCLQKRAWFVFQPRELASKHMNSPPPPN